MRHVVIAGRHDFRLGFAGDAAKVNTRGQAEVLQTLRAAAGGDGYDAAILAVGTVEAVSHGLELLSPRGRLVVFSALAGLTPIDLFRVHVKELQVVGACNDCDMFDEAARLLGDTRLDLAGMITHRFPLERYEQAFALAGRGREEAMKVAFLFEGPSA